MRDAAGSPRCPEAPKANGGEGSIAEQLVGSQIEVLLGGGYARFAQTDEAGEAVMRSAETAGYEIVRNLFGIMMSAMGLDSARPHN